MGTVPRIIAVAVIRIGRKRSRAPSTAARRTAAPARQWSSMKVVSSTEFDTETPMHMIEPMKDSMFKLVRDNTRMAATPQITPGTPPREISPSRKDWK